MRRWKSVSAVLVSLCLSMTAVQAAPCTNSTEWAALRSAAVQQELMVAGLTCQATGAYNRFVMAYRGELQASDADLKAYFIKRNGVARGEAAYDTFKTKLANLSSLSEISNTSGFCASMRAAFAQVGRQSLGEFVAGQRLMIALPEQEFCSGDRPVFAGPPPAERLAAARPAYRSPPSSYRLPPAADEQDADYDGPSAYPPPPPPYYGAPRNWAPPPYPRAPGYYGR